jgi:hypothetical protein
MSTTTAENQEIKPAQIIVQQVGSPAFMMLGTSRVILVDDNTIRFDVKGSKKACMIQIRYNYGPDSYTVTALKRDRKIDPSIPKEYRKYQPPQFKQADEASDVYCDSLHDVIERMTGLYTSL